MKRLLFSLTLVGLLAAACAPLATPEPTRTSEAQTRPYPSLPTSTPGAGEGQTQPYPPPPTGAPSQGSRIPAVLAAIQSLASTLGLPTDQIKLISVEAVEWPDGCLGVSRPDVLCLQVITPGYLVVLEANGQQYEYHTNQDGSIVISTAEGALLSEPQTAAVSTLAHALNVKLADVKVISSTPVEWPDACLGMAQPGVLCAQVITPGYKIVLEANGRQYEYRTNQDANIIVPATIALTWHREGGLAGFCDDLVVYASGEAQASGGCGQNAGPSADYLFAILSQDELAQFDQWLADFGLVTVTHQDPATADAMKMTLTLNGLGAGQPTEADKQALMLWAQDLFTRLQP